MNDAQPNSPVIFLDKNHGLLIRDTLREVGLRVVAHRDLGWSPELSDVEIIRRCADKNYVILSGDKAISRVPEERQAVIDARCKVFMFEDSHKTRTEDWIASILVARQRIMEIVMKTNGPLFVLIKPCRVIGHIGKPDFIEAAGGGWRGEEEMQEVPPFHLEHPNQRKTKPQQRQLNFPPAATGTV